MSFQTEIVKLQRTRRAYLRLALAENHQNRPWYGNVDRRYGKADDATGVVPVHGTVLGFGSVERSLANFMHTLEVPNISVELIDPLGDWKAFVGGQNDQLIFRNLSLWLRVHDDLGDTVYEDRLAVMQVRKPIFLPGGRVQLDCQVASGGFLGDRIPRRYITTNDWPNAPVESQGLPVPFIYGELRNDVVPFTFVGGEGGGTGGGGGTPGQAVSLGRFYPLNGVVLGSRQEFIVTHAGIPAMRGQWYDGSFSQNAPPLTYMSRNKTDSAANGWTSNANVAYVNWNPVPNLVCVYELTAPIVVQGTLDMCFPRAGNFGFAAQQEHHWNVHAYVTAGRTGGVRGTLLSDYREVIGQNNLPGSNDEQTMQLAAPVSLTPVAAQAGDLVVVEIGWYDYNPGGRSEFLFWGTKSNSGTTLPDAVAGQTPTVVSIFGNYSWTVTPAFITPWIEFDASSVTIPPTNPTGGNPYNPTPLAACDPVDTGQQLDQNGGAVRAIRVGGYQTNPTTPPPGGSIAPLSPPVVTGAVVGPGGSGHYQYVVTAINMLVPGAPTQGFQNRNNHTGETNASNIVTITNGPSRRGLATSGGSFGLSNYIRLTWPEVAPTATTRYRVYGRTPGRPFELLDSWGGSSGGTGYYFDGAGGGVPTPTRDEWDVEKSGVNPPATNNSGYTPTTPPPSPAANNMYVIAGHTCLEIEEVYVHKPVVIQTQSMTTPTLSDPVPVLQTEGTDYVQAVIEINGNRYHVLQFYQAQVSETCEYFEITANVKGIETNGDGTGTLITDAVEVFSHIMLNWVLNSYRSSIGPYAPPSGPWYTDVPYAPGLWNTAAALVAKATSALRIPGGYQFAGIQDTVIEARQLIHELLVSGDLFLSFSNLGGTLSGAWSLGMLDFNVVRASLPHYDAANIIFANTYETSVEVEQMVNVFPFFAGPTTQTLDQDKNRPGGGWLISGELRDQESVNLYGLSVSEPLYLRWTRDPVTTIDVMGHYLSYLRFPPIIVRFRTGLQPLVDPVGSLIAISHPDGTGGPWSLHCCQLLRNDADADRLLSDVTLMSFDTFVP